MTYAVGYRKPPVASQFKPGCSGNPKGRPKGSKNYNRLLFDFLDGPVAGRKGKRTELEVLLRMDVDRAISGDKAALKRVFKLMQVHDTSPEPVSAARPFPSDFQALREKYGRIPYAAPEVPCSSPPNFPVSNQRSTLEGEEDQ